RGGAREVVLAEGHGAEHGAAVLELDLALDHLPPRLDVADGLQERDRDGELFAGAHELAVDALEELPRIGLGRIDRVGDVDAGVVAGLIRVATTVALTGGDEEG